MGLVAGAGLGPRVVVALAGGRWPGRAGRAGARDHRKQRVDDPDVQVQQRDQRPVPGGQQPEHRWGPGVRPHWVVHHARPPYRRLPLASGCLDPHIGGHPCMVHEGLWPSHLHTAHVSSQGILAI